uniref:Uncharacterized protein n=1 Tax=Rhizophora mucronata TaxID=61149 RepID=A0A2P2JEG9_RHIMU
MLISIRGFLGPRFYSVSLFQALAHLVEWEVMEVPMDFLEQW